ncbi:MAG: methyltransferase domain-containing protein [Betaproteobacteria bacterium]|nr:methyltransferase domain-containing protein [Betaproteobacteria bacterium]
MLRALIKSQQFLSRVADRILFPRAWRVDGNRDYLESLVHKYLREGITIYDLGGGKNPFISLDQKKALSATVVGLDICENELSRAPDGVYDRTIVHDIATFRGHEDADLVLCRAVLEHVRNTAGAIEAISSILRPGGKALIFVPSRNALYARLNKLLPEHVKKMLLFAIYPGTKRDHGFPAFYDQCVPSQLVAVSKKYGMEVAEERYYFISYYFFFCFPCYIIWRIWLVLFWIIKGNDAAETFSVVLVKK